MFVIQALAGRGRQTRLPRPLVSSKGGDLAMFQPQRSDIGKPGAAPLEKAATRNKSPERAASTLCRPVGAYQKRGNPSSWGDAPGCCIPPRWGCQTSAKSCVDTYGCHSCGTPTSCH